MEKCVHISCIDLGGIFNTSFIIFYSKIPSGIHGKYLRKSVENWLYETLKQFVKISDEISELAFF